MSIRVEEVVQYRILGYNNMCGIAASSTCSEQDVEKTRKALMSVPGVMTTHVVGPMLIRREVIENE